MNAFRKKPAINTIIIAGVAFVISTIASLILIWLVSDHAMDIASDKLEAFMSGTIKPLWRIFSGRLPIKPPSSEKFIVAIQALENTRFLYTALGISVINMVAAGVSSFLIYMNFKKRLGASMVPEEIERIEMEKTQAEILGEMKSEFLVSMSHELKTPLNGILGLSESMMEDERDEQKLRTLRTIQNSGKSLLELINEILDLAKLDSGKMAINTTSVNLNELVDDATSSVVGGFKEKGVQLKIDFAKDMPEIIEADGGKLMRILINLVSNAYKYTDSGSVVVSVSKNSTRRRGNLFFQIHDSGMGISSERMPFIFESFIHGESMDGTGLGLPISRGLVELMGGEIWCVSEPDRGSTFSFTINANLSTDQW